MYHKEWDHNAMVDGIFEEFATEINAKIDERTREIAKKMKARNRPVDEIVEFTSLSAEEVDSL